jgi:hypothetical protein
MLGDVLAGGCVVASDEAEALTKVRAFYNEMAELCCSNENFKNEKISVWDDCEGFLAKHPDVIEVYP